MDLRNTSETKLKKIQKHEFVKVDMIFISFTCKDLFILTCKLVFDEKPRKVQVEKDVFRKMTGPGHEITEFSVYFEPRFSQ